ncbi:hypothetical protein M1349_05935 [Patescibacteria group bacterium]|nr:hypothetical protein [Patescibacteria group bacterium]
MACLVGETPTDLGCIPNDPYLFVVKFYAIGLGLIGGVSLLFIIYGAYLIMLSQGNPEKVKNGREYIYFSIAGLLLAVFGYVFIRIVVIDILHIPGFS